MATPNYSFAKRQRELAKKKKKEEKRERKAAEQTEGVDGLDDVTTDESSDSETTPE